MRLSVTSVEQLNYYDHAEYVNPSIAQIVSEIMGVVEETDAMRRGTAFHKFLEDADSGDYSRVQVNGYTFDMAGLDATLALPCIAELKAEHHMVSCGVPVVLVGKVDAVGTAIHDHKLSKAFNEDTYCNSLQWRCYLEMFDADVFQYNVFVGKEAARKPGVVKVTELNVMRLYRYPNLQQDVQKGVDRFVTFCKTHCPERLVPKPNDVRQLF